MQRQQVIDLTQEIYQGMPVHVRHQKTFIFTNISREEYEKLVGYPFHTRNLLLNEHGPTHADALAEFLPGGPTIDEMSLDYFYGPAICLDLSQVTPERYIEAGDLEKAVASSGQTLGEGDILLLYTGHYERHYPRPEYLSEYSGLSRAAAMWIADQGVVNIGVDAPSIDHPRDPAFSGHIVCAERRITNSENLCNLHLLVNKRFLYFGLPLKIRGGTGSPMRAFALMS
jgi:kynurenine formamidase